LPLSYFQRVGIDKIGLSRFERGLSMMGFEKVDVMLQEMNVSLAEYELVINHFVPDFQEEFLFEVEEADFAQDEKKLNSLYKEAKESGFSYLALSVKSRFEKLTLSEINFVVKLLTEVTSWGYFELSIAYFVLDHLDTLTIQSLMSNFEQKNQNYFVIYKYRRRIFQIFYRALVILSSRGEKKLSQQILKMIEKPNRAGIDLYLEVLHKMAIGFYNYSFVDENEGLAEIRNGLAIFDLLGQEKLKDFYGRRNKHFLNKNL
jgi:HTH-type transcriptional regulator, SHP2-responsive activator